MHSGMQQQLNAWCVKFLNALHMYLFFPKRIMYLFPEYVDFDAFSVNMFSV